MKAIVLGAAGAMAAVVMRDLLEFAENIRITAADARPVTHFDSRVTSALLDVKDEEGTARLMEGHDVAINCVTYYLNVPVMRAALAARVPYVDLGGLYHGSMKQFELHDDFVAAGVPALLGMGSTPGITNVMAGALAKKMERVDEMHVRVACLDRTASGPLPVPYALDTVLDEFALEPMIFENGKAHAVPPMSGREVIEFPAPAGRVEALYTLHSEVAMFPRSYPSLTAASFKVAFPEEFVAKVKFLVELGFASREKIVRDVSAREMLLAVASRQQTPPGEPADCDVLQVHVRGWREGKACSGMGETIVFPHPEWHMAAGSLDTGVPQSIAAQMLASRKISGAGVLCPELAVPHEPFFLELEKRGIHVKLRMDDGR